MPVEINGLSFSYRQAAPSFNGLSLRIEDGECAVVYGANGSGKSTLISVLAGIAPEFCGGTLSGSFSLGGKRPACVLQNPETQVLCDGVEEELAFFLRHAGARMSATEAAELAGIESLLGRESHTLSSGEKQRLVLACALACAKDGPLLLDEPGSYADAASCALISSSLGALKQKGSPILIAAHPSQNFTGLADSTYILKNGKLEKIPAPPGVPHLPSRKAGAASAVLARTENLAPGRDSEISGISPLSLSINNGELAVLTGPNGCGKSTLARIMAGIETDYSGRIFIEGKEPSAEELLRAVRMCGPDPLSHLLYETPAENMAFAFENGGGKACLSPERGAEAFGLSAVMGKPVSELSFGTAQRVSILCAILAAPKLLIADEALSALDYDALAAFYGISDLFLSSGGAILAVSHLPETAKLLGGREITLNNHAAV